jgi:hypothetical protein
VSPSGSSLKPAAANDMSFFLELELLFEGFWCSLLWCGWWVFVLVVLCLWALCFILMLFWCWYLAYMSTGSVSLDKFKVVCSHYSISGQNCISDITVDKKRLLYLTKSCIQPHIICPSGPLFL